MQLSCEKFAGLFWKLKDWIEFVLPYRMIWKITEGNLWNLIDLTVRYWLKNSTVVWRHMRQNKKKIGLPENELFYFNYFSSCNTHLHPWSSRNYCTPKKASFFDWLKIEKQGENSKKGNVAISNLCAGMTSEVDIPVIDQLIHFQRYKYIQKVRQQTRRLSSRLVLVPRQQTEI